MHATGERYWAAEVSRLQGELLLWQGVSDVPQAETCVHQAWTLAREEAKALALRAAMSLARLWQQQGKQAEAYTLLAPTYGWFTEDFDTASLQDAKVLLDALA
jgi:predicted ATPase